MLKSLIIYLINLYQKLASQLRPHSPCRFSPTCSQYAKEAIVKYGILKGGFLGGKRILKCHPLSRGGIDPVK